LSRTNFKIKIKFLRHNGDTYIEEYIYTHTQIGLPCLLLNSITSTDEKRTFDFSFPIKDFFGSLLGVLGDAGFGVDVDDDVVVALLCRLDGVRLRADIVGECVTVLLVCVRARRNTLLEIENSFRFFLLCTVLCCVSRAIHAETDECRQSQATAAARQIDGRCRGDDLDDDDTDRCRRRRTNNT
jgi:hypothetical protein